MYIYVYKTDSTIYPVNLYIFNIFEYKFSLYIYIYIDNIFLYPFYHLD